MRALELNDAAKHELMENGLDTIWDGGSLVLRTGTQPGVGSAESGTEVATLSPGTPAFGTPSGGEIDIATWTDDTSATGGTPGWFRLKNVGDTMRMDGTVGVVSISDSGTATSGAVGSLTDTGKSWTVNAYMKYDVRLTGGTGSGQRRRIIANSATVLYVDAEFATAPDATSTYEIIEPFDLEINTATITAGDTVTADSFKFAMPRY